MCLPFFSVLLDQIGNLDQCDHLLLYQVLRLFSMEQADCKEGTLVLEYPFCMMIGICATHI
jgi:hypothetical protein